MFGKPAKMELDSVKVAPRTEDAKWHISYFGDTDKEWKEIVMKVWFSVIIYRLVEIAKVNRLIRTAHYGWGGTKSKAIR